MLLRAHHLVDMTTKAGRDGAGENTVEGAEDSDGAEIIQAVEGTTPFVDQGYKGSVEITKQTTGGTGVKESLLDKERQRVRKRRVLRVFRRDRFGGELSPELVRDPVNPGEGTAWERGDSSRDVLDGENALWGERQ